MITILIPILFLLYFYVIFKGYAGSIVPILLISLFMIYHYEFLREITPNYFTVFLMIIIFQFAIAIISFFKPLEAGIIQIITSLIIIFLTIMKSIFTIWITSLIFIYMQIFIFGSGLICVIFRKKPYKA